MSVELISVLVAVLAIGATLAGLILTSNRGLRQDIRQDQVVRQIEDLQVVGAAGSVDKINRIQNQGTQKGTPGDSGCTKERFCNTLVLDRLTRGVSKNPVEQAEDGNGQQNN